MWTRPTAWDLIKAILWTLSGGEDREILRELRELRVRINDLSTRIDRETAKRPLLAPALDSCLRCGHRRRHHVNDRPCESARCLCTMFVPPRAPRVSA